MFSGLIGIIPKGEIITKCQVKKVWRESSRSGCSAKA